MWTLTSSTFGADLSRFGERDPLPNSVYACHDYTNYGFPNVSEPWTGSDVQKANLTKQFARKTEYMKKIGGPIWSEWHLYESELTA